MNLLFLINFSNFFLLINCQNFLEENQKKIFLTLDERQDNKNNNYSSTVNEEEDLNEGQNLSTLISKLVKIF